MQFLCIVIKHAVGEALRLRFAKKVDDAITRHSKEPARNMIDRHQQAVCFNKLVKDVLQDVLDITRIGNALSNEMSQPGLLTVDLVCDALILFECHLSKARCVPHLFLKTDKGVWIL